MLTGARVFAQQPVYVAVRALRNVRIGPDKDLLQGETGKAEKADAAYLVFCGACEYVRKRDEEE